MPKKSKQNWVRTGGAYQDDGFDKIEAYQEEGCGVKESVRAVGPDPNEGISLPKKGYQGKTT